MRKISSDHLSTPGGEGSLRSSGGEAPFLAGLQMAGLSYTPSYSKYTSGTAKQRLEDHSRFL